MPIDVTNPDHRLTLEEVAAQQKVDTSTVWRWASPVDHKKRPKPVEKILETATFGGRRYTTPEAVRALQKNAPPKKREPMRVDVNELLKWKQIFDQVIGAKA